MKIWKNRFYFILLVNETKKLVEVNSLKISYYDVFKLS